MRLFLAVPVMGYIWISLAVPMIRQQISHLNELGLSSKGLGTRSSDMVAGHGTSFPVGSSTRLMKRVPADESGAQNTPEVSMLPQEALQEITKERENVVTKANAALEKLRNEALEERNPDGSEADLQRLRVRYGTRATKIANVAKNAYIEHVTRIAKRYSPDLAVDRKGYQKWKQESRAAIAEWPGLERDTDLFGERPINSGHIGKKYPRTEAEYELYDQIQQDKKRQRTGESSGASHSTTGSSARKPPSGKKINPKGRSGSGGGTVEVKGFGPEGVPEIPEIGKL
jgi:hypothetical protein